jgi:hypothetical protein
VIGPAASILFAAWIFMGFLQQRYDAAIERYRACIAEFRGSDVSNERRSNLQEQVLIYRRRCKLMSYSSMTGLVSAIVLLLALISGELSIVFPAIGGLNYVGAIAALLGFVLIIGAAVLVIVESTITHPQSNHAPRQREKVPWRQRKVKGELSSQVSIPVDGIFGNLCGRRKFENRHPTGMTGELAPRTRGGACLAPG